VPRLTKRFNFAYSLGPGRECAGAGVGGTVRAALPRVGAGRGSHDEIEAMYWTLKGYQSKRDCVFDADGVDVKTSDGWRRTCEPG